MAMTPEQRKTMAIKRREARKKSKARERDNYFKKQSHDWHSTMIYTGLDKSSGYMSPSHCKKCGFRYDYFKLRPLSCKEFEAIKIVK
jgi:predicted Zn-ribbon and HTH transcriptional regulator